MPWYYIVLLACLVTGPFDALYLYIRNERRKDALKKKRGETGGDGEKTTGRHH